MFNNPIIIILVAIIILSFVFQKSPIKTEGFYTYPVFPINPSVSTVPTCGGGAHNVKDVIQPIYKTIPMPIKERWEHPGHVRHVKLNDYNGVDYVDDKPPCSRGDFGCRPVSCPAVFDEALVCWKCSEIINDPQNNYYWE